MKRNLPSCFSAKGDGFGIRSLCNSHSTEQLGKQSEKIDGPFSSAAKDTPRKPWAHGNTDAASFWCGPVHTSGKSSTWGAPVKAVGRAQRPGRVHATSQGIQPHSSTECPHLPSVQKTWDKHSLCLHSPRIRRAGLALETEFSKPHCCCYPGHCGSPSTAHLLHHAEHGSAQHHTATRCSQPHTRAPGNPAEDRSPFTGSFPCSSVPGCIKTRRNWDINLKTELKYWMAASQPGYTSGAESHTQARRSRRWAVSEPPLARLPARPDSRLLAVKLSSLIYLFVSVLLEWFLCNRVIIYGYCQEREKFKGVQRQLVCTACTSVRDRALLWEPYRSLTRREIRWRSLASLYRLDLIGKDCRQTRFHPILVNEFIALIFQCSSATLSVLLSSRTAGSSYESEHRRKVPR